MNNLTSASEAEMETEIATIKTQYHKATIERRLAEVWSDCDCGFSSSNAVTGSYAKAGNHQKDLTTIMISALAINKAVYL